MVTIVKGNDKIICTQKTFEDQFKVLGYCLASENKKGATEKVDPVFDKQEPAKQESTEDEKSKEEIISKYGIKSHKGKSTKKEAK